MPNPSSDFPTAIHTPIDASANADSPLGGTAPNHADVHGKVEQELVAIQAKIGVGASPASAATDGQVLTKQNDGSTAWESPSGGGGDVAGSINAAPAKTTPVDADLFGITDSAASFILKKLTWANIKATLKTYFDTLYATVAHTHAQSDITNLTSDLAGKQPLDADLTTIAAINSATTGVIASDGAGWITKTYSALKTALSLVKGDVGLGNVDNTSDADKPVSTAQQTALDAKRHLQRLTFNNAAYVISATKDAVVAQIGTMSASRAVTLPAANSVPAGTELMIMDASGTVTSTNTIVITRAGSDTINGATTDSISTAYGWRRLVSDGSSKWNLDAGLVRQSQIDTDATLIANSDSKVTSQKAVKTLHGNRWATQISLYKQPITGATVRSAIAMVANRAYFHMFQVPKPGVTTLTDILIEITTGSAATGRFGVFYITDGKDPANGVTLIADLGTVDLTSTAVKETTVSQVLNYDWILIGVYCPSASPVWRGLNSPAGGSHSSFQQIGYHSGASYVQDRPIMGWTVSGIDYSAGMPSSIASLTQAPGGSTATPVMLARFSY